MKSLIPRKYPFEFPSERDFILSHKDDPKVLGQFVTDKFQDDFTKAEDLVDWAEVIEAVVSNLRTLNVGKSCDAEKISIASQLLTFLGRLIRAAKDKRCFVGFKEIHTLMQSQSLAIAQLASEVIFHVCVPASSISSNVHDDWADCIEVPMFVAETSRSIFSCVMSLLPGGSFAKFLNSEEALTDAALTAAVINSIGKSNAESAASIVRFIKSSNLDAASEVATESKTESELPVFLFHLIHNAMVALDAKSRELIVRIMLYSFFILIHSKIPAAEVIDFVKTGPFTSDLVAVCDISKNAVKNLGPVDGLHLSHVCLENILGLIESRLRRRSSMTLYSNILQVLDLDRTSGSPPTSSEEVCWISIVSSGCANSSALFDHSHVDTHFTAIGKFARLGLELYALALTVRDQSHTVTDIRAVSIIVGLLRACQGEFQRIAECGGNSSKEVNSNQAVQLMLVMSKILYCLELTVQKPGYTNVFRECDGLEPVMSILNIFSEFKNSLDDWFSYCPFGASILETALSVVTISIQKYRPSATIGRSLNESGFSFLFVPAFVRLGQKIMEKVSGNSDTVWGEYLLLVKEIIDAEPTYLAYFLQTDLVPIFKTSFMSGVPVALLRASSSRVDLEHLISPLLRFAHTVCITNEGRNFMLECGLIEFVIDGIQNALVTVPYSYGISTEKVAKIGSGLGQILMDNFQQYQQFKPLFVKALRAKLEELLSTIEFHTLSSEFMSGVDPASPRCQLLQRLTNLCTILESIFSVARRQQTDLIKEVVVDFIPKLFTAYQCCFPPPSQLLTQISLHTNTGAQTFGHTGCMKAITSVLKVTSSSSPQDLMHHILKIVEDSINKVTTAKMMLARKESIAEDAEDFQPGGKVKRIRSRGSSFGTQAGTQAHIYGALESIPDATLETATFTAFLDEDEAQERYLWQFLTGVSTVEWLCLMLSHALRSMHRSNNHAQLANIVGWKDNLRHLFSFLKSASLEVATYSAQYLGSKPLDQSKMKSSLDVFLFESGLRPLPGRFVDKYILRVIGTGGALVREGVEIDGSRVVYVVDVGTEIEAFERKVNAAGVIRYRTELGWISEYRRDQGKSPIVEAVRVTKNDQEAILPTSYDSEFSVLLSVREGAYCTLVRLNQSLRQLSVYLARLVAVQEQRLFSYFPQAHTLAGAMTKFYKGYMDYADERLSDSKSMVEEAERIGSCDHRKFSTRCLFIANFIKNAMLPALEDKNGNFNVLLLRGFSTSGLIKTLIDDWCTCFRLLMIEGAKALASTEKKLSSSGRCALYANQIYLVFIRKLVNRDALKKSTATRAALVDDNGAFSVPDLASPLLVASGEAMLHILLDATPSCMSSDMTSDFIGAVVETYKCIKGVLTLAGNFSSTESESASRGAAASGQEYTPLRVRTMINRFVEMGFRRNHINQCIQAASDPNDFEEIYEALVATLRADDVGVVRTLAEGAPTVGIEAQEAFNERDPSTTEADQPGAATPPIPPATNASIADALPNLVSSLGTWDELRPPAQPRLAVTPPENTSTHRRAPATNSLVSLLMGGRSTPSDRGSQSERGTPKPEEPSAMKKLDGLVRAIKRHLVPFTRRICEHFHLIEQWDKRETFSMFPYMRASLQSLDASDGEQKLLDALVEELLQALELGLPQPASASTVYGIMIFCSSVSRGEEQAIASLKKRLSYPELLKFVRLTCAFIETSVHQEATLMSKYVAPAVIMLSQLLSFLQANEAFIQEQLDLLLRARLNPSSNESKDEELAPAESKETENLARPVLELAFRTLVSLLDSFEQTRSSRRVYSAVVDALVHITSYHGFADQFVANQGLQKILSLRFSDDVTSEAAVSSSSSSSPSVDCVSRLLQKCLETPALLQVDFAQVIKNFFLALGAVKTKISFDKFLRGHFLLVSRSPEDFWLVSTKLLKFSKSMETTTGRKILMVEYMDNVEWDQPLVRKTDRSYIALKVLVDHCAAQAAALPTTAISTSEEAAATSSKSEYVSFPDCIQVLSEISLSVRNGANIVAFVVANSAPTREKSLVDFLLHYSFGQPATPEVPKSTAEKDKSPASTHLQACTRLFLSLAAARGAPRALICQAVLRELQLCTTTMVEEKSAIVRLSPLLQRLCRLMVLISQSNKVTDSTEHHRRGDQGVAVDTIKTLVIDGKALDFLVTILLHLDHHQDIDSKVWVSLMSAIELFTRPQLLHTMEDVLEKDRKAKESAATTGTSSSSAATAGDVGAPGAVPRISEAPSTPSSSELMSGSVLEDDAMGDSAADRVYYQGNTPTVQHRQHMLPEHDPGMDESALNQAFTEENGDEEEEFRINFGGHDHDDHDHDHDEEDEEEDDEGDEEEDEDDEDDEEGDDEDDGEEDEDDGEEDEDDDGDDHDGEHDGDDDHHHDNAFGQPADINGILAAAQDALEGLAPSMGGAGGNHRAAGGREDDPLVPLFMDPNTSFGTLGGDRARQAELLSAARSNFESESRSAGARSNFVTPPEHDRSVQSLLRTLAEGVEPRNGSFLDEVYRRLSADPAAASLFSPDSNLPFGLTSAGTVAVIADEELLPMPVSRALESRTDHSARFNPYINQTVLQNSRAARWNNRNLMFGRRDVDPAQDASMGLWNEDEEGMPLPGMFPGGFSPAVMPSQAMVGEMFAASSASSSTGPPGGAPSAYAGNVDSVARAFQERFETILLQESESAAGDDSVAGDSSSASQVSTTATSRTEPQQDNSSLPSTSVQAVQDPNPRQNGGEDDSVRGGPIPPLIEIEEDDHEAYEEMSVLTVPQEEQHEDTASVGAMRASGYRNGGRMNARVALSSGESVGGSVDDQETIRTTPNPGTVADDDHTIRTFPPIEEEGVGHEHSDDDDDDVDDEAEEDDDESDEDDSDDGDGDDGADSSHMGGVSGVSAFDNDTLHSESRAFDNDEGAFSVLDASEASVLSGGLSMADPFLVSETPQIPESDEEGHLIPSSPTLLTESLPTAAPTSGVVSTLPSAVSQSSLLTTSSSPVVDLSMGTLDLSSIVRTVTASQQAQDPVPASEEAVAVEAEEPAEAAATADGGEEDTPTGQLICPPGYDADVFYSLPPEMQMEVIEQHGETANQMRDLVAASGFDYETIMSLPDDIRQEVLDQARRQRDAERALLNPGGGSGATGDAAGGAGSAAPAEVDNMTFLSSLPLDLRSEVLLTAEQSFLESLPAEVQAEAQTLRERAASNWQRHEIIHSNTLGGGGGGGGTAAVPAVPNAPFPMPTGLPSAAAILGGDDESDFDEEDYDEDMDGDMIMIPPSLRDARSRFRERPVSRTPRNGLVRMLMNSRIKFPLPPRLLLALTRVLVSSVKHPSRVTDTLMSVLLNICRSTSDKYDLAKLFVGLITNQPQLVRQVTDKFDTNFEAVMRQLELPVQGDGTDDGSPASNVWMLEPSSIAWCRVVFIMTSLCAQQGQSLSVLGLLPRSRAFDVSFDEIGHFAVTPAEASSSSTPAARAGPLSLLSATSSTESLLEQIVRALPTVLLSQSQQDLEVMTHLIDNLSQPLDALPDNADGFAAVLPDESQGEYAPMRAIHVAVPPVYFDRDSLAMLCDVLLSDLCTARVVRAITTTLGRVTKFQANATVAMELMCDALGEIGGQTKLAVDQFTHAVRRSTAQAAATAAAAAESAASVSSSAASASASAAANVADSIPMARVPSLAVIPLVDSVDHHVFDRFVRVIQTLQSIAEKATGGRSIAEQALAVSQHGASPVATPHSLYDIAPVDTMNQVWTALDHALTALKIFVVDDDSLEAEGIKSTPKLTSLLSAARRLLPLIESFFLIYASDLLKDADAPASSGEGAASAAAAPAAAPAAAIAADATPSAPATTSETPAVAAPAPATPAATSTTHATSSTATAQSKIPGQRFRTTVAYQRANISLPTQDTSLTSASGGSGPTSPDGNEHRHHYALQLSMSRTRSFGLGVGSTSSVDGHVSSRYRRLVQFVHNHRSLLNLVIKSKPILLETSFAPLIRVTQLRSHLSFEVKRKYFFAKLKRVHQQTGRRGVHLQIRRNQVFEDSYQQLRGRSAGDMRGRLQVQFYGEQGIDAGGLSREWYSILAREIFNPGYALFMAAADGATFQPNPLSFINSNHLEYFKFVGRIIGKAICDRQLMDAHFTRSFYKHLLGMPIEFGDIEATEPDYYKSLKMMLDHPLEDLGFAGMTFTAEIQKFGRTEDVELIPNGANIAVTDENKHEYVRLIAHHRMTAGIFPQIDSFLAGFYELVPPELICIFSPTELELLICGLPDVNIDELQLHTEYGNYRPTDSMIRWFWEALRSFNREERASFLQFVTGTSKVPLGGFAHLQGMRGVQKFSIHKADGGDRGLLPSAHTCYNQLDLPEYSSAEELREKLLLAISEGSEGFGFA